MQKYKIEEYTQRWVLVHEKNAIQDDAPLINFASWDAIGAAGCTLFPSPGYTFFEEDFYQRLRKFRYQLLAYHNIDFVVWAGYMSPQQRAFVSKLYEYQRPSQKVAPPGDPCLSRHTFAAAADMMFMQKGGDASLFMQLVKKRNAENIERYQRIGHINLYTDPVVPDILCETARITTYNEEIIGCARANGLEPDKTLQWHFQKAGRPPHYTVVSEIPSRQVCITEKSGTTFPVRVTECILS